MKTNEIINTINATLEVNIRSKSRKREIVYSRFIFYRLMRNKNHSLEKIGSFLDKDHATVIHGLKQFDNLIEYEDFKEQYDKVVNELKEKGGIISGKIMKQHTTNNSFFEMFKELNCTQAEMGHLIDLDKNSVHDWLKNKNEMKFSKLEEAAERLGKKVKITIE